MDHIVELAYTHSTLANPVFPCLNRQTGRFGSLDLPPEVVSLTGEKVALPEDSTKELVWVAWEVACLEEYGCLLFRWSACGSARHRSSLGFARTLGLPLILMVSLSLLSRLVSEGGFVDDFTLAKT